MRLAVSGGWWGPAGQAGVWPLVLGQPDRAAEYQDAFECQQARLQSSRNQSADAAYCGPQPARLDCQGRGRGRGRGGWSGVGWRQAVCACCQAKYSRTRIAVAPTPASLTDAGRYSQPWGSTRAVQGTKLPGNSLSLPQVSSFVFAHVYRRSSHLCFQINQEAFPLFTNAARW